MSSPEKPTRQLYYALHGALSREPVYLQFSDGVKGVPVYIVNHMGGEEELQKKAQMWSLFTYQQFLESFWSAVRREQLNRIGREFVAGHFRGLSLPGQR
jgi:hypothetical protein